MKPKFKSIHPGLIVIALSVAGLAPLAQAASDTWSNGGADNNWQTVTNWTSGTQFPGLNTNVYTSIDDATFSTTGAAGAINLGNQINLRSLIFGVAGGNAAALTVGDANDTLNFTTAGGVTINTGVTTAQNLGLAGATINLSNAAAATATLTNNGSGLLTAAGNIVANVVSGNGLLSVDGSGNTSISGAITKTGAGSNALLKTGAGTLTLSNGSAFSGAGAIGYVPATSVGFPLVVREGTLLLNGGTHTITGEAVIGGVVANGGAGQNAKLQIDAGSLAVGSWLSVGRGNGVGGVSSDLVANNAAAITTANLSAGFNGGNAANLVKGTVTLNNSSTLTVTANGAFNLGENAGSNITMTLNGSSQVTANATTTNRFIGNLGLGTLNINASASFTSTGQTTGLTYIGYRTGTGILNMTGGTFNTGGDVRVGGSDLNGAGPNGTGTFTISGGTATVGSLTLARGNNNLNTVAGTGTISGGTVNSVNDVTLGFAGNNNLGKLTVSGGTFNVGTAATKWLMVGRWDTSKGQLDVTSGSVNLLNNTAIKMNADGTVGANVINQSGGAVTFYSDAGTTAGGAGHLDMQRVGAAASNNTYNLNGGTLTVPQIISSATTGTRTFNFNGGTLKAPATSATFMNLGTGTGIAHANVRDNGAIINSNGFDITIAQALEHSNIGGDLATDGGLTKQAAGILTLSAANTYTGATSVTGGTLNLTAANTSTGATTVTGGTLLLSGGGAINSSSGINVNGSGAKLVQTSSTAVSAPVTITSGTLDGTGTLNSVTVANSAAAIIQNGNGTPGTALTVNNLTFTDAATLALSIDPGLSTAVIATTTLNSGAAGSGKVTVNATSTSWLPGQYNLISYTGSIGGGGFSEFLKGTITGLSGRQSATLTNPAGLVALTITGDNPRWTGALNGNWTTTVLGAPKNWGLVTSGTATDYINGDIVLFDDTASTGAVVISSANVTPLSTTFANNSLDYNVTGSFGIAGSGSVTLNGTASVALATANSYSGGTNVNAGTLKINNASAIGTGALSLAAGATIDNTSGSAITLSTNNAQNWNGDFTFAGSNGLNLGTGAVVLPANRFVTTGGSGKLTVGGVISGAFGITKTDTGTLALSGANTYTGATTVSAGTLLLTGAINAANTAASGQVTVGDAGANALLRISGGTLNATKTAAPGVSAGSFGNGTIIMDSGTLNATNELWLASANGSYGSLTINGGAVNVGSWLAISRGGGTGILNVRGGTLNVATNNLTVGTIVGGGGNSAVATLSGGVTTITAGGVYVGEITGGVLNVSGGASLVASGALGVKFANNATTSSGILNLNGGTITTPIVQMGLGTNGTFNFNGGTLKASAATATFMQGLTAAHVYGGGAVIDTNALAITVAQPLLAPSDSGVSSVSLSANGTGYLDTPLVTVTGGTLAAGGVAATALANLDYLTGEVTGITITNPGSYTDTTGLAVTFTGGGGVNPTVNTIATAANTGGGLTVTGAGTLTLPGSNTYTGATAINAGTLVLSGTGSINGSSGISINGSGAKLVQTSTTAVSPTVSVANGTLDGVGTLATVTVANSAANVVANGNGGTGALAIGSLSFADAATVNLKVASTAPAIATTTLNSGAAAGGKVTVNATNASWTNGQVYNLISYSTLGGGGFGEFLKGTITGLTTRQSATLTNPAGNVALTIAGDLPVWSGGFNGEWSTATITSPKNWKLQTGGGTTDFLTADTALFNDTATGTTTINIAAGGVSPTATTFSNSTLNYTLTSAGSVGVATGVLVKGGTASATLSNANTYAGGTTVDAGTLNINNAAAIGTGAITLNGGAIGNTSAAPITLTTNNAQNWNGDFTFSGPDNLNFGTGAATLGGTGTVRGVTVSSGTLTVDSIPVATGFSLTKAGAGTLALTGTVASNLGGDLNVTGGVFQIGANDLNATGLTGGGTVENGSATTRWLYINNATDKTFTGILQNGSGGGNLGLFKSGLGTLTLTGANNYNDQTTVTNGKLVFSGTTNNTRTANVVGNTAGQNGVLEITSGSTFGANFVTTQFTASLAVGSNATAAGSVKLDAGGTLNTSQQLQLGTGTGGYGAFTQHGGTSQFGSFLLLGANNDRSVANIEGGSLTMGNNLITMGAGGTGSIAVMNISGGTVTSTATTGNATTIGGIFVGEFGTGTLNLSGTASVVVSGLAIKMGVGASASGVVNLGGGTLTTTVVAKGAGTGNFNFNGGTLKPGAANATFMQGLTSAYVRSGGALIDSNGFAITVAQPLLVPTGGGVTATGLTVSGGGYIDTPLVQITGDGTGATAVATIDASGNLTGITITNRGNDYTTASFALVGGGIGNTGAIGGTAAVTANVGGGLVKSGIGTLTLGGVNTYTGITDVQAGTLAYGVNDSLANGDVQVSGGTLDLATFTDTVGAVTLASGSISGSGGVLTGTSYAVQSGSVSAILGGSGALTKSTAGTVTLSGVNTYTGNTIITGGTLAISNAFLADAADVSVAVGASMELSFTGTDTIDELTINGIAKSPGTYGGTGSGATHIDAVHFLPGTGTLTVTTGPSASPYAAWATAQGLNNPGVNDGATQDPDKDGISNALEFVLGGNPLTSNTSILPVKTLTATDFIFTFNRADESEAEITAKFQYGSTLTGWTDVAIGATTALSGPQVTVTENGASPDTVTVTIPRTSAVGGKLFGRLNVVK